MNGATVAVICDEKIRYGWHRLKQMDVWLLRSANDQPMWRLPMTLSLNYDADWCFSEFCSSKSPSCSSHLNKTVLWGTFKFHHIMSGCDNLVKLLIIFFVSFAWCNLPALSKLFISERHLQNRQKTHQRFIKRMQSATSDAVLIKGLWCIFFPLKTHRIKPTRSG